MKTTITKVEDAWSDSRAVGFVTIGDGRTFPVYAPDLKALARRCLDETRHVDLRIVAPFHGTGPTYIQRIQIIDPPKDPA